MCVCLSFENFPKSVYFALNMLELVKNIIGSFKHKKEQSETTQRGIVCRCLNFQRIIYWFLIEINVFISPHAHNVVWIFLVYLDGESKLNGKKGATHTFNSLWHKWIFINNLWIVWTFDPLRAFETR